MSRTQKIILSLGLLVVAGFCLRPPYQWEHTAYLINRQTNTPHRAETLHENIGHHWIWAAPTGWYENVDPKIRKYRNAVVDWPRAGVYAGLTTALALFLAFVLFRQK